MGGDGKFLKVLVKKFGGIQACLGPSDPLTGNGEIVVKPGCIDEGFCLRSPLNGFGGIVVKLEESLFVFYESHIHALNMARG